MAVPPYLRKNQDQELKMTVPKKRPGGRIVIRSPDDIQKALARRINRILSDQGEDTMAASWQHSAMPGLMPRSGRLRLRTFESFRNKSRSLRKR
jgi:hypothetical protein